METTEVIVKMVLDQWNNSIKTCNELLNVLSDETLEKEIVQGKNRGIYILGHLIAVHDEIFVLLDLGEKLYPELYEPFLNSPDKTFIEIPPVTTLRRYWINQCEVLKQKFSNLKTLEWFEKHTSVSAEDFINQPHRNKLNVVLTRATHVQYHIGQLQLVK